MTTLRSVFISDVHLGAPHAHADELAALLTTLDCEKLYLVGDIVDLWWVARKRDESASAGQKVKRGF